MSFYWLFGIIPFVGTIAAFVGAIMLIVYEFKFMSKYSAPTLHYILFFIFPIILPWLWQGYFNGVSHKTEYSGTYEGYSQEQQKTGRRTYH